MSNNNNSIRNDLNLQAEELYMVDPRSDAEMGEMYIDECDLEKARAVLEAALLDGAEQELDAIDHESPSLYNGVDWDDMAYLVEIQLFMRKCMDRIKWIDRRLEEARAGDYLPREQFMSLVAEKKSLWSYWNAGKAASQSLVGNEKKMWRTFFNMNDHEAFLQNHLSIELSLWNTYGRDDGEEESHEKFHVDPVEQYRDSHLQEMVEYNRNIEVSWKYHDKRLARRLKAEEYRADDMAMKSKTVIENGFKYQVEIDSYGDKSWYLNGQRHREDGLPAIEYANGTKFWYLNGQLHREDGLPAIEWADGTKEWFLNNQRHREDGPAIEYANGIKSGYSNGQRYREDGLSAVKRANGTKFWYLNGIEYTEEEHYQKIKEIK